MKQTSGVLYRQQMSNWSLLSSELNLNHELVTHGREQHSRLKGTDLRGTQSNGESSSSAKARGSSQRTHRDGDRCMAPLFKSRGI